MKKQSITIRKAVYASFITIGLILSSAISHQAMANEDLAKKTQINYIGKSSNLLTFKVDYQNVEQKKFVLELVDQDSQEVLYQKTYNDTAFSKNLYVSMQSLDCNLTFRIRSGKDSFEKSFSINSEVKLVEDMIVKAL
jgi:hypothetical protein